MKEIKLTQGKFALIDDDDFDLINQYKWHINKGYAKTSIYRDGKQINILMHRLILGLTDTKNQADHINHVKTDNRRSNLRSCNNSENQRNTIPRGRSKYKGVSFLKDGQREYIRASININSKWKHLGIFPTEELAARAYDKEAKIHFGDFANLNFK